VAVGVADGVSVGVGDIVSVMDGVTVAVADAIRLGVNVAGEARMGRAVQAGIANKARRVKDAKKREIYMLRITIYSFC